MLVVGLSAMLLAASGPTNVCTLDMNSNWEAMALAACETVKCENGPVGDARAAQLAVKLREAIAMCTLDLTRQGLGDDGIFVLVRALRALPRLVALHLAHNAISHLGTTNFWNLIVSPKAQLEQLVLHNNRIGPLGMGTLAKALSHNGSLTHLDVRSNRGGSTGGRFIGDALRQNGRLRHLALSDNAMGNHGVLHIALSLRENSVLESLALRGNQVTDAGVMWLAQAS